MESAKDNLSNKQQRFCEEYIKDANATQAYIRAGYSKGGARESASRLLSKVNIRAYIDELRKPITEKCLVDAEFVINSLVNVAQKCQQAKPVMVFNPIDKCMEHKKEEYLDEEGKVTVENLYEFDSSGANRALELLGKHLKLFTDKIEHSVSDDLAKVIMEARERAAKK